MIHGVFLSVMSMGWPNCRFFCRAGQGCDYPLVPAIRKTRAAAQSGVQPVETRG
jgi:hypothetical protein